MSRALLDNEALFRGSKPHDKEVEMLDGSKGTFHIRDLRDHEVQTYFADRKSTEKGEDPVETAEAHLCSIALVDEDGTSIITAERAATLKTVIRKRLVHAILDANGFIAPEKTAGN